MISQLCQPGEQFGRLTVLRLAKLKGERGSFAECRCSCGNRKLVRPHHLKQGRSRSCGCLSREDPRRHGRRSTPEYYSWAMMIQRCCNPKAKGYKNYGGKGIKVCASWRKFIAFLGDVGSRPKGTTLDRFPDPKGNYEPGNVRWATRLQQARNKRSLKLSVERAREIRFLVSSLGMTQASVAKEMNIDSSTVSRIIGCQLWRE